MSFEMGYLYSIQVQKIMGQRNKNVKFLILVFLKNKYKIYFF